MHGLLRPAGDQWTGRATEVDELLKVEAAALPGGADAPFNTPGYPGHCVTEEVGPGVVRLNVYGFHSRQIVCEPPIASLLKEGSYGDDVLDGEGGRCGVRTINGSMESGPCCPVRGLGAS